ncbi:MAG: hypothetical protein WC054_08480 [Candidatus Nanopelagicales bacterium]
MSVPMLDGLLVTTVVMPSEGERQTSLSDLYPIARGGLTQTPLLASATPT